MSDASPVIAPTPVPASSTLAPPSKPSRQNSTSSNRSRKGAKSNASSSNVSRSNSRSSRGGAGSEASAPDKVMKSGHTTTISGGTPLGVKENTDNRREKGRRGSRTPVSAKSGDDDKPKSDNGTKGDRGERGEKRRPSTNRRPQPINTDPSRSNSRNSNANDPAKGGPNTSQSAPVPKSIHTAPSAPKTALEAARDAAVPKLPTNNNDALTSLQKMISDLKSMPTGGTGGTGNGGGNAGSQPASRSTSGNRDQSGGRNSATSPVPIPDSATSSQRLKADAPSFTPSYQSSSISPVGSHHSVSPAAAAPPQSWSGIHPRSSSHSTMGDRRTSSPSTNHPYFGGSFGGGMTSPPGMYGSLPQFPFQNQLQTHQEMDNEAFSSMNYGPQADIQRQLLAAHQVQYQQIQLLQAQLAASQLAQQQVQAQQQNQQQMGNYTAPRFQALAAHQAAQQQQQQALQLAQAQQLFEMQQQKLLEAQRQQEELQAQARAQAREAAQAALQNPVPVFEEDSPEKRSASLGTTGRPQLAPTFTFGVRKTDSISSNTRSMSPQTQPPVINRSEGIGGAAATGLAGLAARAHKRTGSELSSAMQQQLELQQQIEALQAKQKALMQEEHQGDTPLSQLNNARDALASKTQPSQPTQPVSRHRRVQSSLPSASLPDTFGSLSLSNVGEPPQRTTFNSSSDLGSMSSLASGTGHSRRHSVNVFNKPAGIGAGFSMGGDIPEDGVLEGSIGGHHRSGSRGGLDGNWRTGQAGAGAVSDLAAAQAQLQSLAQFRAAAGGGHSKMASFSFPNMLPNLLAATTLSTSTGQTLLQQQQAFQMQLQQSSLGPQRKTLFAPYLPQASLPPLLSAGKLVVGILRVNKRNRSDAYVATDVLETDIYICGSKDRNRALEGDIVAVELLDVDEVWSTKKDKEEKKRKKEENAAYDLKPAQMKKLEKKKDDVEVEGQGLTLFDDEEVDDETKPTYAGHVVAVVERVPGQLFSGQLGVLRPSSAITREKQELERKDREGLKNKPNDAWEGRPKIVWFKPTDKRVPLIAIPTEQAPTDFIENPDAHANKLFVATIKRWPITSLHPFGTLVEELGPIGDREVETSALLKDCNFPTEEFSDATLKCLPPLPWSIPEREFETRKDLRNERVFTIDPPHARDLDDALSVKHNDDGTFTVGVHIADVSYFVKTNTHMDRDAKKRATSVYLVQRAVPMLPPQVSEELCSLQPDAERLTFSALFTMDRNGNVLAKEMARTIIKSSAKLAYGDAQAVIEGKSLEESKQYSIVMYGQARGVQEDIRLLHELATKLREKRIEAGAIISRKVKISVNVDENGQPVDCEPHQRTDANSLIEEFMLLANTTVARIIANGLPEQALLRRHEAPIDRRIEGFINRAKQLGFDFDSGSAADLQKGFENITDPDTALCLELLKRRAMQQAKYFCTGMMDIAKYPHWALATPVYTHFTSPIRRYADIMVHRMLDACLTSPNANDVKFFLDRDSVARCAQQCNMKKQSAKVAEEQSVHLYLSILIHDLTERYGPVVRQARVTGVLDQAFDVVVPEFGIEKRVHVDKIPVENVVYDEHKDILSLYWTKQDVLSFLASTSDDPHILKIKSLGERKALSNSTAQSRDADSRLAEEMSQQYQKSAQRGPMKYEGLRSNGGHRIQDIKELTTLPVIVTSDMTKSPPVLVVYACNPYAP